MKLHPTLLFFAMFATGLSAQDFAITSFSFGGGGSSTNGGFTLTGKAETGADTLSGGGFTLASGYFAGVAIVPTPGAPEIVVTRQAGALTLTWNTAVPNWILESSPAVGPAANWTAASETIASTNHTHSARISFPTGIRYYRLRRFLDE